MIYLDNGATSFRKPPGVYRAVELHLGVRWRTQRWLFRFSSRSPRWANVTERNVMIKILIK